MGNENAMAFQDILVRIHGRKPMGECIVLYGKEMRNSDWIISFLQLILKLGKPILLGVAKDSMEDEDLRHSLSFFSQHAGSQIFSVILQWLCFQQKTHPG